MDQRAAPLAGLSGKVLMVDHSKTNTLSSKLDKVMLRCVCGGLPPVPLSFKAWDTLLTNNNVFQYQHIQAGYRGSMSQHRAAVTSLPEKNRQKINDYVMIHIPAEDRTLARIGMGKSPGLVLDQALADHYKLDYIDQYCLYHVTPTQKAGSIVTQFVNEADVPLEYVLIMKKTAYQELAMQLLAKFADPDVESMMMPSDISKASLREGYATIGSPQRKLMAKVIGNTGLTVGALRSVTADLWNRGNEKLATALRDIATALNGHAARQDERRSGPPETGIGRR